MTQDEARSLFSEYRDGSLDDKTKGRFQQVLAANPEIASEFVRFQQMLDIMRNVPQREPSLDLWREFAPKLAEYQTENRLSLPKRLNLSWHRLLSNVGAGLILYTHALADRTHARFERYLLSDPVQHYDNNHTAEGN